MATKKKKKKTPSWKTTAKELSTAEYAGLLTQLGMNSATNTRGYQEYVKQRNESLGKQIGSDRLATQITGNVVTGLKNQAMGEFNRSATQNQAARALRDQATSARNSNALSNYEAEMKARGINDTQAAAMKSNLQTQQGLATGLDAIDASYQDSIQKNAMQNYDAQNVWTKTLGNSFEANARAQATEDFNERYNSYVATRDDLAAQIAKAKKDQGASYLNTALTLKKEAQQAAAEREARKLSAAQAMSNAASSDYFRSVSADQAQQRNDLARDKFMASLQKDINAGKLKRAEIILRARAAGYEPTAAELAMLGLGGSSSSKAASPTSKAKGPGKTWNPTLGAWM